MAYDSTAYLRQCLEQARDALLEADRVARELVRDHVLTPQERDKIAYAHGRVLLAMPAKRAS